MHPSLTMATRAAFEAGKLIRDAQRQIEHLNTHEKTPGDFVSQVDVQAEEILKNMLWEKFPHHCILAEESGLQKPKDADEEHLWIIDPLDGTSNYLHGFRECAISMAYMYQNKTEAALVYNPFTEEMFTATRGEGAQLNQRRIRVTTQPEPSMVLIGTGFPFKKPEMMAQHLEFLRQVLEIYPDIRRCGSAALDLCAVACGRLQGFFEIGLKSWDIAAGALMVQESGGIVSSMQTRESFLQSGNIIAAAPDVYQQLKKICLI